MSGLWVFDIDPTPLILSLSKDASATERLRMAFWTYMLRCSDGSYYVGHTDDIDVRIPTHNSGIIGGYTSKRRPVVLVWSDQFRTRDEAFAAERKLKGWSRAKKEALIRGDWGEISFLARNRQGSGSCREVA
jgi:predicted GIY-YIG superfamily endonuclease